MNKIKKTKLALLLALVLALAGSAVPVRAAVPSELTVTAGKTGQLELGVKLRLTKSWILRKAKERADYVRVNNFQYGNAMINPAFNKDNTEKLVSCDRYVQWVLYDLGFHDLPEQYGLLVYNTHPELDFITWCEAHGFMRIDDMSQLKAGDIVFLGNGNPGHVYLLGNKIAEGQWERYDCGERLDTGNASWRIQQEQPFIEPIDYAPNNPFCCAYRIVAPAVSWTSSDESVARVDENGVVTGVSQGVCEVTAKSDVGKKVYTVTVEPSPEKPGKPSFTPSRKVSKKAKTFTVTTSTVNDADGFEIRYSRKKSLKSSVTMDVKTARKARRVVVKTQKSGERYYIRVRAYKNFGGEKLYGPWSNRKSIKSR